MLTACLVMACGCTGSPVLGSPSAPSSSSSSSSAPSTSSAKPQPPRAFTLAAGGDILIHPAVTDQAAADGNGVRNFTQVLDGLRGALKADLSICHLETPLSAPGAEVFGYPAFSAPPEVAKALVGLGYDSCSTASNHTLDRGAEGITNTLAAMDAVGLKHTGSARSPEEAAKPLILDAKGVKVAQLSFTYGFNGIALPQPWMANELDPQRIIDAARAARAAGAEVVVVSIHWGTEYVSEPNDQQRQVAAAVLADPAVDLIIGTHVHRVQPIEKINGKWVVYGMGNEIAKHEEPRGYTEEGLIARFHFVQTATGWTVDKAEYLPTLIELGPPIRVVDLTAVPPTPRRTQALKATDEVVRSLGGPEAGLTRP